MADSSPSVEKKEIALKKMLSTVLKDKEKARQADALKRTKKLEKKSGKKGALKAIRK